MSISILWVALEFSLRKIQAMTMQFMRFETAPKETPAFPVNTVKIDLNATAML